MNREVLKKTSQRHSVLNSVQRIELDLKPELKLGLELDLELELEVNISYTLITPQPLHSDSLVIPR